MQVTEEVRRRVAEANEGLEPVELFGMELNSGIGVASGPLQNSKWLLPYAAFGWDIVEYKTRRAHDYPCHPSPNVVPLEFSGRVDKSMLMQSAIGDVNKPVDGVESLSITNSFGNPSTDYTVWTKDAKHVVDNLAKGQMLVMSYFPTPNDETTRDSLLEDFAFGARAARRCSHALELNLSCPNVKGRKEGSFFTDAELTGDIVEVVRGEIGSFPLMLKLGYYTDRTVLENYVRTVGPSVDALVAINTFPMKVFTRDGKQALPGEGRLVSGVCGAAITGVALETVREIARVREKNGLDFALIGVGGIMTPDHAVQFFDSGCAGIESATAAMWNPLLAVEIKERLKA
jgi:dihydroorotate dehydrogenase